MWVTRPGHTGSSHNFCHMACPELYVISRQKIFLIVWDRSRGSGERERWSRFAGDYHRPDVVIRLTRSYKCGGRCKIFRSFGMVSEGEGRVLEARLTGGCIDHFRPDPTILLSSCKEACYGWGGRGAPQAAFISLGSSSQWLGLKLYHSDPKHKDII